MRGALIHGVLLAVMLVYGYRTWTRDKTVEPTAGSVTLWDKPESDLVSIEYKAPKKIVKLERKPEGYWWGSETTIEMKPKPPKPGDGSLGLGCWPVRRRVRLSDLALARGRLRSHHRRRSKKTRSVARRTSSRSAMPRTS